MRKSLPTFLALLLLPLLALAQGVTVPNNIYFADIHLKLNNRAQAEIQKKVDALQRSKLYFQMKVDLADAYFPIIERVFKEEGVPDDYKYLALQESGLIGDAVSTSNAVGYWQFKREAALDFNLRMDRMVDERRHIVEASRGAAKYFKRSNGFYNNWVNSLLSYYLGYTGAKAYTKPSDNGAREMDITERTNEYILTFLAHKVAYDAFVGKANPPAVSLRELRANPGQSLSEIAVATKTDYSELEKYNKWLLGNSIPSDKDYYVMIPVRNGSDVNLVASAKEATPALPRQNSSSKSAAMVKRNNLNALVAREKDTKDKLALQAGISTRRFLKYNDMHSFDKIVPGTAYYIEPKRTTADAEFHVVQPGETMQMISQHYGMRLSYMLFKNRMKRNEVPVPGRVLWLQKRRPAHTPVEVRDPNKQNVAAASKQNYEPVASAAPSAPEKDNFFTRLLDKLKGNTQPEREEPIVETSPVAEEETLEETPAVEVAPAAEAPSTQAPPKTNTNLYPGTTKNAATKAKEEVQEEEEFAEVEPELEPAPDMEVDPFVTEEAEPVEIPTATTAPVKAPAAAAKEPAPAQQPKANATTHIVKQGETLWGISRMYAVSINDLTAWNNLSDAPLKLGQELLIAEPLQQPTELPFTEDAAETPATMLSTSSAYHTVDAGETLYQISKKYNVPVDQLRQWNSLQGSALSLGQELRVKAPAAPAAAQPTSPKASGTVYHTVAAGESMYQISRKYDVTIKDIMEWNNKPDFSVSAGERLEIRKK
ncbi:LysM peptidoglycan-binding domain-containing protein [Pontibacter anaerobius]|uniref:LysM peptidoglycan-binding domain-containing protein n=1 Tax=Pontibacter anaerobius TaxID=2993940 RepID=A0ABT3RAX6_9BACT|nr:LysM peptidoglycan-binding domain-containing protein [Pontibacter anaerobius]MCX2738657.1 LysM peptidoglycan-binding domain-containing protein [Pontibacter anaerobius]